MKNYIIDGKGEETYIQEVISNSNGTLTIIFADGRVFKNIAACGENIEKIVATQEEQAKRGISNYRTFAKRKSASKALTAVSGIAFAAAATGATFIPTIYNALGTDNPFVIAAGIGVVTILGTIPAYVRFRRDKGTLAELDKLKYRNEHKEDLEQFRDYPNALSGVDQRVAHYLRSHDDPFSILNIDEYSRSDLEQIMTNINVEKAYDFTYKKASRRS